MCKIEVMDFLNLNRNLMKKMDYNDIKNKANRNFKQMVATGS